MKKQAVLSILVFLALVGTGAAYRTVKASDHDDGENDAKARALNLTDHYVFTEKAQSVNSVLLGATGPASGDDTNLVFVQNSNPRSLPGYQYYFSQQARYDINIKRIADKTVNPNRPSADVVLRFDGFGAPDATGAQSYTFHYIKDGADATTTGTTTVYAASKAGTPVTPTLTAGGVTFSVFAGLREDPFFFDVNRFFQVRAFLIDQLVLGPTTGISLTNTCGAAAFPAGIFNEASCAPDFTKGFNVNSLIVMAPRTAFQSGAAETTFDTWSTVSIPH
jgi:hypothetical protein